MLYELGFPLQFIDWIMPCVQSVTYSILVNGKLASRPFNAKKGLRQGDPLSPFLFALSMKYVSRCLGELKHILDFNLHPKCERLHLTHLIFADNLLLFSGADHGSVTKVMQAFKKFSIVSSLQASPEKSNIFLAGVNEDDVKFLADAYKYEHW